MTEAMRRQLEREGISLRRLAVGDDIRLPDGRAATVVYKTLQGRKRSLRSTPHGNRGRGSVCVIVDATPVGRELLLSADVLVLRLGTRSPNYEPQRREP